MGDLGANVNNSQSLTVSSYCFLLETNDVMYWSQVKQMFSYISLLYWFLGKHNTLDNVQTYIQSCLWINITWIEL